MTDGPAPDTAGTSQAGSHSTDSEIKSARLGLIGTLVAAFIAAIIGGGVAGYFTIRNTRNQANDANIQARTDFFRMQQQTVYVGLTNDAETLSGSLNDWELYEIGSIRVAPADSPRGTMLTQIDKVITDSENVQIIGRDSTISAAGNLTQQLRKMRLAEINQDVALARDTVTAQELGQYALTYQAMETQYTNVLNIYVAAARADIRAAHPDEG